MKEKLKTIGLTIVITLVLSLIIGLITNNLIIKGGVLGVLLIVTLVVLLKKFKKSLWVIILPALISAIISFFVPTLVQWSVVAIIVSLVAVEKIKNPYKTVICMLLITALLTWILPTAYYNYDLIAGERNQVGLFSLLSYPVISLSYFGNVALYVLVIGMFYGILYKVGAYRNLLDKISRGTKGKEGIVLSVIIVIMAMVTSVCGASQGVWFIIPFIISVVLLMGYDRITAAMVTIAPIAVGLVGNTFASTYISDAYGSVTQNGMGIINAILNTKANALMIAKVSLLILGIAITIVGTLVYASKNKTNKKVEDELLPISNDKKTKLWPLVVVFDLIFIIAMLSLTSWTSVFNLNWFQKATEWITSFEVFGFPLFGKIFGGVKAFERWSIDDISALLVFGSVILALIYKIKISDFIEGIAKGAKKALKPAALIVLTYVVLVIVSYHPIVLTIIKPLLSSKFNALTMGLSALISNVFNVDLYYSASTTLPYVTSLITDKSVYSAIALVWQAMYGFASLAAPTSLVLIAVLSYLDIPYGKWLKSNWLTILGILALIFIVLIAIILLV